ncbi:MAG: DNA polymerase III subunit delta' [Proteobacteria bacterium]|nr:MAG: DNA polymerase III subunit delta' [Pseudomonadota bacterium]
MTTATGFNGIIGQPTPVRQLRTFIRNGTLPHALLFIGDDGVGKKSAATALAMACNCTTLADSLDRSSHPDSIDACGQCSPCRKIAGDHHPDILHVAPISAIIRIAQIRSLLETLALRPNEARQRVVIVSDAQAMNLEAGNALLKVLEEPPEGTLFVLTAGQTFDLLPTIVSRCRQIRFCPLATDAIKRLLARSHDAEEQRMETAASLSAGSYTRAKLMMDSRWLNRRDWIIRVMEQMGDESVSGDIRVWLAFAEMLAKNKARVEESLGIITMWLRDMLVVRWSPRWVFNRDKIDLLTAAARRVSHRQLLDQMEAVDAALSAMRSNTNLRLTMDAMVLRMAAAVNG